MKIPAIGASEAAADELLGLAPQPNVQSTPVTLALLESGTLEALPPALPPNLQARLKNSNSLPERK